MSAYPIVSVIMAVYNGAAWLPETVASLQAQTLADWELIAVDDCSKDDSVAVLQAFGDPRIHIIRSPQNGGPVIARNRAFSKTRGRYVAGLDQDDISLPARFALQAAYLDAHPEVALVSSAADYLIDGRRVAGNWPRPLTPTLIDWLMLIRNPLAWSSVMFRADAARQLVPFERPSMRYVEDFDLYHRIRAQGRIAQIDEVLMLYRCHDGGASNVFNTLMRMNAEALLRERHREMQLAHDIASSLVRHVMAGEPVPDTATFDSLSAGIDALRAKFGNNHDDPVGLATVDREISQLRWRLCRTAVRSGMLPLHQIINQRPTSASMAQAADLLASQAIGGIRRMYRRLASS